MNEERDQRVKWGACKRALGWDKAICFSRCFDGRLCICSHELGVRGDTM